MEYNMQPNTISSLKKNALPIVNTICVIVQMYVTYSQAIIVADIRDWSVLPFPVNGDFIFWLPALMFSVVWLAIVSVSTNKRLRITLTAFNVCTTIFSAFCLIIAEVG
ncbi:MAG: hypothetical protein LBL41_01830 [Bifidobacteriaceae bacterium]|nr:hypothetical protein [Bifidobacteriaceae bacterium]